MVKSMFSERMDMKMEWPRQTKTEIDRDGSGYHDNHREERECISGGQKVEAKGQRREKATRGE